MNPIKNVVDAVSGVLSGAGDVVAGFTDAVVDGINNITNNNAKSNGNNKDNVAKVINEVIKKVQEDDEKNNVRIAFFGQPGSGKSSLINDLIGRKIMPVGQETDVTKDPCVTEYTFTKDKDENTIDKDEIQGLNLKGVFFTDFPGHGTSKYPPEKLIKDYKLKEYDVFICVFSNKLHQADEKLFSELYNEGKICIFVRNQCDSMYQEGKSFEEMKEIINNDIISRIGEGICVIFTSCKTEQGIEELTEAIANSFPDAQKAKYYRIAKAYSDAFLVKKKNACEQIIVKYSLLSAVNGLNPIAGLDIAIDFASITKMLNEIKICFGLGENEIDLLMDTVLPLAKDLAKCVTTEGILELVKKFIGKEAAREVGKFVPIVGPLIIASTSFGAVYLAGKEFASKCYEASKLLITEANIRNIS